MPFEANKNSKELGIDTTRKFKSLVNYLSIKKGDVITLKEDDGTSTPFFWNKNKTNYEPMSWSELEYADEPTLPPYILCSTPELAKQVLEKIERDFPDKRWRGGSTPTGFIPYNCYPDLIIHTLGNLSVVAKVCIKNQYKDEHITTAEEYLGLATTEEKVVNNFRPDFVIEEALYVEDFQNTFLNKMIENYYMLSYQPLFIKPTGNKIMSIITNAFKSKEDKALEKLGLGTSTELNEEGRREFINYIYETGDTSKKGFLAKVVEIAKEDK